MNWFPSPGRLFGLWLLFVCAPLVADTVELTNGSSIDGKVLIDGEKRVVLQIGDLGTMEIARSEIVSVLKNNLHRQIRTDSPEPAPATRDKKGDIDKQQKPRPDLPMPQAPPKVDLPPEIPELSPKRLAQVKLWVYELQRQRSRNRTRAERSLGQVGPGVIPHLLPVARSPFDLARISALRLLIKTPHFKAARVALEGLQADNQWVRKLSWQLVQKISGVKGPFSWQDQSSTRKRSVQIRRWHQWFQQQERQQLLHQRWLEQQAVQSGDNKQSGR